MPDVEFLNLLGILVIAVVAPVVAAVLPRAWVPAVVLEIVARNPRRPTRVGLAATRSGRAGGRAPRLGHAAVPGRVGGRCSRMAGWPAVGHPRQLRLFSGRRLRRRLGASTPRLDRPSWAPRRRIVGDLARACGGSAQGCRPTGHSAGQRDHCGGVARRLRRRRPAVHSVLDGYARHSGQAVVVGALRGLDRRDSRGRGSIGAEHGARHGGGLAPGRNRGDSGPLGAWL